MLIRAYGMYWNPDVVDWGAPGAGNQGELIGKVKQDDRTHSINFWDVYGIYVLHQDFSAVYVGKASETRLGMRLRNHLTDRHAGRWDMFSWFSLSKIRTTKGDVSDPGNRYLKQSTVNSTLEALAILIADPKLNRRREALPSAVRATQVASPHPRTIRSYLERILQKLNA
jgi:hypothetical protein